MRRLGWYADVQGVWMESVTRAGAAVRFLALFLDGDLLKAFSALYIAYVTSTSNIWMSVLQITVEFRRPPAFLRRLLLWYLEWVC